MEMKNMEQLLSVGNSILIKEVSKGNQTLRSLINWEAESNTGPATRKTTALHISQGTTDPFPKDCWGEGQNNRGEIPPLGTCPVEGTMAKGEVLLLWGMRSGS